MARGWSFGRQHGRSSSALVVDLPFGLIIESSADGRLRVGQSPSSGSPIALRFDDNGELQPVAMAGNGEAEVGAAAKDAAELIEQACRFDRYPAALRAIEELLALQLEAGVKHLQRTQQEGHSQGQRMLPILAAQKAAKRQLHQALVLLHGDEQAATRFAVGIKSLCSNYSEEIELCIRVLAAVETFLVRAGTWFAAQAMDQCLDSSTVAALVTFSAAGSQANAARGLLQDALQYWE